MAPAPFDWVVGEPLRRARLSRFCYVCAKEERVPRLFFEEAECIMVEGDGLVKALGLFLV